MDLTVSATPGYFATMAIEHQVLKRRAASRGPSAGDYEARDTRASLAMGVLSVVAGTVGPSIIAAFGPRTARYRKALVATAAGAVVTTLIADRLARDPGPDASPRRRSVRRAAARVARVGSMTAVATGGFAITSGWTAHGNSKAMWERRIGPDLGEGPGALAAAIFGWDFIYYWNHRFMHTSRYMWAIHVVHHSSERYNLSTALRQPVADVFGTFVPYGLLAGLGIRPRLILQARAINLLYQYWIHTETIPQLGPFEQVFNTASHHRVHHGSNPQYLDRNHGSILIVWDRLFGTFEPEADTVVYGLTTNLNTFNPARIAAHEHFEMLRDVGRATNWKDRASHVLRGPGWSYARRAERTVAATAIDDVIDLTGEFSDTRTPTDPARP